MPSRRLPCWVWSLSSIRLTEAEVERFLQAAKSGRHGIRDHLMMLLLYRHRLRETELCRLTVSALDLETARIGIDRTKNFREMLPEADLHDSRRSEAKLR